MTVLRVKILAFSSILAVLCLLPTTSFAQQGNSGYTLALSLVLGGTSDASPDPGFDNLGFQAMFSFETSPHLLVAGRVGLLPLETDEGSAFDADLTYLTVGGEYRLSEGYYESGLFIGLGIYDLAGDRFVEDETSVGLNLGVTGDFRINGRFSFLAELMVHAVDMEYTNFFVTANAGIAYHF
jgi:hypothetical protein